MKSPVGDLGRLLDGSAVVVLDSMAGSVRSQVSDYGMDENVNGVARRERECSHRGEETPMGSRLSSGGRMCRRRREHRWRLSFETVGATCFSHAKIQIHSYRKTGIRTKKRVRERKERERHWKEGERSEYDSRWRRRRT